MAAWELISALCVVFAAGFLCAWSITRNRLALVKIDQEPLERSSQVPEPANRMECQRAEQTLREYTERFELAERAASFGIWEWDPKSGLFSLSEATSAMVGFGPQACRVTSEELYANVHPDDQALARDAREQAFTHGGCYETEFRRVLPGGSVRWYRNRGWVELEGGVPKRVVGAVIDISQQKELLLRLERAKEAAEAAAEIKSQFLANMSHEIRTPMNAVMGMTSLLLDLDLTPEALDYVSTIRTSSDSLLAIINDILDFSKIESGKFELEHIPFALGECLEQAVELLAPKAAEKQLDLSIDIDADLAEWIYGDVTRLRQIVVNLVGNAVKFTSKGEVVVRAGKSRASDGREEVHVSVCDTGIGIEPAKRHRLFQLFSQVDSSTTRKFGGTGLGLAISKRLTELMGGRMWVESEPGAGSTFQFTFPYEPAPVQNTASMPEMNWTGKEAGRARKTIDSDFARRVPLRILVAEDNAINQKVVVRLLERWGYRPDVVGNGLEVLDAVRRSAYDIVLLDVQMPEMDGLEAARRICSEWAPDKRPMLTALTAGAMKEDRERCLAAGMDDYLTKPLNVRGLQSALERCRGRWAA